MLSARRLEPCTKSPSYTFPLYDGVSVVNFECSIDRRIMKCLIKEKEEAKVTYQEAIDRGEMAGLLEQHAADVFTTSLGNVPPNATVCVNITFAGELKHDAEVNGIRFTIPTFIFPRYGLYPGPLLGTVARENKVEITVDIKMDEGSTIQKVQSPSHPISVTVGSVSEPANENHNQTHASATLTLGSADFDEDFVLQICAKDSDNPCALLETHSEIPNQRAVMATVVPNFSLQPQTPEIILMADRSGSMTSNMATLISALQVFIKSLPVGVHFNICSFGTKAELLWPKSKAYDQSSVDQAMRYIKKFAADFGGTEIERAMRAVAQSRSTNLPTEIVLLTDGNIWQRDSLIAYVNRKNADCSLANTIRFFAIGIGSGISTAVIEGVAAAGNGFAQFVQNGERLDNRIVRVLKGALTPHIEDYRMEVKYANAGTDDEEWEIIDKVAETLKLDLNVNEGLRTSGKGDETPKALCSATRSKHVEAMDNPLKQPFADLPTFSPPALLQVPTRVPPLFPHTSTTLYLLLTSPHPNPISLTLRATTPQGPVSLAIPIQNIGHGRKIHQLAARKAVHELEDGRGWLADATDSSGRPARNILGDRYGEALRREAVRLGVKFQIAGRHTSFVAVQGIKDNSVTRKIARSRKETLARLGIPDSDTVGDEASDDDDQTSSTISDFVLYDLDGDDVSSELPYGNHPFRVLSDRGGSSASSRNHPRTGGKRGRSMGSSSASAPRKQLASKAARRAAPATGGRASKKRKTCFATVAAEIGSQNEGDEGEEEAVEADLERGADNLTIMHRLINRQTCEGKWRASHVPWAAMGIDFSTALAGTERRRTRRSIKEVEGGVETDALATACVVQWLEERMGDEADAWDLLADKARRWLSGAVEEGKARECWVRAVELVGD